METMKRKMGEKPGFVRGFKAGEMTNAAQEMSRYAVTKVLEKKGESIAETLVAVLIGALALMMLAGAITASSNLVTQGRNKIHGYMDVNEVLIQRPESVSSSVAAEKGSASISFTDIGVEGDSLKWQIDPVSVEYFKNNTFSGKPVVMYHISSEIG